MAKWRGTNIYNEYMLKRTGIHNEWVVRQMYNICTEQLSHISESRSLWFMISFSITRSCAALRAADLDWIVGPGYSLGGTF